MIRAADHHHRRPGAAVRLRRAAASCCCQAAGAARRRRLSCQARRRQDGQSNSNAIYLRDTPTEIEEDPSHAHRPGARAPQRPRRNRRVARCSRCIWRIPRRPCVQWAETGLSQRRHWLPGMQGTADRFDQGRSCAAAGTRAGLRSRTPIWYAASAEGERARDEARETLIDVRVRRWA